MTRAIVSIAASATFAAIALAPSLLAGLAMIALLSACGLAVLADEVAR